MKQPRCLGARLASGLLLARGPPAPSRPSGETPVLPQPLRLKPPRRRRSLACSRRAATPRPNRARRPPYPPPPQRLGPPRRLAKQREELRARLTCRKARPRARPRAGQGHLRAFGDSLSATPSNARRDAAPHSWPRAAWTPASSGGACQAVEDGARASAASGVPGGGVRQWISGGGGRQWTQGLFAKSNRFSPGTH